MKEAERAVESCPHCGCKKLLSADSKDGRKRFKCSNCKKSFNALTKPPFARLRMANKHIEYAECMVEGLSVRKAAERMKISVSTAFRWRHRFLANHRKDQGYRGQEHAYQEYSRDFPRQ